MNTQEILDKYKNITVYGMSTNSSKPANYVPFFMYNKGYEINAVNPTTEDINGIKSYPSLAEVEGKIEILNVFRASEKCLAVVEEAVERKKAKGDIDVIWLQLGIVNEDARKLAEENGIEFVQDRCLMQEYKG